MPTLKFRHFDITPRRYDAAFPRLISGHKGFFHSSRRLSLLHTPGIFASAVDDASGVSIAALPLRANSYKLHTATVDVISSFFSFRHMILASIAYERHFSIDLSIPN